MALSLFIMHGTLLVYCRHKALHHHSLQRKPESDGRWAQGSRGTLLGQVFPSAAKLSALLLIPHDVVICWIMGYNTVCPYILRLLAEILGDKGTDQCYLNSLKPAGLSLLKFQPEGISLAKSRVERFSCRILSEDISTEEKC